MNNDPALQKTILAWEFKNAEQGFWLKNFLYLDAKVQNHLNNLIIKAIQDPKMQAEVNTFKQNNPIYWQHHGLNSYERFYWSKERDQLEGYFTTSRTQRIIETLPLYNQEQVTKIFAQESFRASLEVQDQNLQQALLRLPLKLQEDKLLINTIDITKYKEIFINLAKNLDLSKAPESTKSIWETLSSMNVEEPAGQQQQQQPARQPSNELHPSLAL